MNRISVLLLALLITHATSAQQITGSWYGVLSAPGAQLRLVFHIEQQGTGYTSAMDSPDQGVNGIPVTTTKFEEGKLTLEIPMAAIQYEGRLRGDVVEGTFRQAGQSFTMNLSRERIEQARKPQEPVAPYPYKEELVTFKNQKAGITLSGTLTIPADKKSYPLAILITGSGPQNRDEELLGHKPFLVLADYLTRQGIAVLRYDDRGTAESTGNFETATSADFARDVQSAIDYVKSNKQLKIKKIGLVGHSEGGMIASMVAAKSRDVQFVVLMAGPGTPGKTLLLDQQALIARGSGVAESDIESASEVNKSIFDIAVSDRSFDEKREQVKRVFEQLLSQVDDENLPGGMSKEQYISMQVDAVVNPWMVYFLKYDPAADLKLVKCPVFALNGEKDVQVPSKKNLEAIEKSLRAGGNKRVEMKEYVGLNHLFQTCETGLPLEYSAIQETISPKVLEDIAGWISRIAK